MSTSRTCKISCFISTAKESQHLVIVSRAPYTGNAAMPIPKKIRIPTQRVASGVQALRVGLIRNGETTQVDKERGIVFKRIIICQLFTQTVLREYTDELVSHSTEASPLQRRTKNYIVVLGKSLHFLAMSCCLALVHVYSDRAPCQRPERCGSGQRCVPPRWRRTVFRHARRYAAGDGPFYGDTQRQSAAVTRRQI